jgi:hypothetical protein
VNHSIGVVTGENIVIAGRSTLHDTNQRQVAPCCSIHLLEKNIVNWPLMLIHHAKEAPLIVAIYIFSP